MNKNVDFKTLKELGLICGQGFRSGANTFFILQNDKEFCVSKIKNFRLKRNNIFYKQIIQNQRALGDNYSIESETETSSLLVIPRGYASTEDIISISNECYCILSPVTRDIQEYINIASKEKVGDTMIPELSAVKTNIKNKDGIINFWYNLPTFTKRHNAEVFVPRVNGGEVISRYNPNHYIIDANFITFWINSDVDTLGFNSSALMALLNSSWFNVLCEESGIVMGGGALKLDSVQIQRFPFPCFTKDEIQKLSEYGELLISTTVNVSKPIINLIDSLIVKKISNEECTEAIVKELQLIKKSYQLKRSK